MPITPGEIEFAEHGVPASPAYGDIYHSADGGLQQARSVFLQGCQLPAGWQEKTRFVLLETGFGLGLNFLATWQAFREYPGRCTQLHFISIEKHPLGKATLERCHAAWPELAGLAQQLRTQWPLLVAGYHRLSFDEGRVQLTLIFEEAEAALKQLDAKADAIYLDGFSPAKNPEIWSPSLLAQLKRLASPGARLATWCVAGKVRHSLQEAGFEVARKPGFGHKKERLEAIFKPLSQRERGWGRDGEFAEHAPRLSSGSGMQAGTRPAREGEMPASQKTAAIIGAGISGCALAHALCRRGWQVDLIERHHGPAQGASGNPAGVVRPQLALDDSFNGRLSRQAFLHTVKLITSYASRLTPHASHDFTGVLQLARDEANAEHMQAMLDAHRYPDEFVRWLTQDEASELAGVPLTAPGLYFPSGGWMTGPRVCEALLAACGDSLNRRFTQSATRLEETADGWGVWEDECLLAESPTVILAGAHEAAQFAELPLTPVRGQITKLPDGSLPGLRLPVTREGYVLPTLHGIGNIGASFGFDDDPAPRTEDQEANLARLSRLLQLPPALDVSTLAARVSFRAATPDRLPLVGAIADKNKAFPPETALEHLPRTPGLFTLSGLGARGLVWGPFLADALAARLDGEPWMLPRDLWQAIDPARFVLREARRRQRN